MVKKEQKNLLIEEIKSELSKKKIDITDIANCEETIPTVYTDGPPYSRVVDNPPSWLKRIQ